MSSQFNYNDQWQSVELQCSKCGWIGTFEQGAVEYHDELMDSSCPVCPHDNAPILAIVSYPVLDTFYPGLEGLSRTEKMAALARRRELAEMEILLRSSAGTGKNVRVELFDIRKDPKLFTMIFLASMGGSRC